MNNKRKHNTALLIILFISCCGMAQNGINYKSMIIDSNGNNIEYQSANVRFIISEGAAFTTNLFQKMHRIHNEVDEMALKRFIN